MAKELDLKKLLESTLLQRPDSKFCDYMIITDEVIKTALKDQGFKYKNGEIVSIEPESTIIKAGKWYVCDAEMTNENMNVAFHRDEVYYCPKDGWIDARGVLFKVGSLCRYFHPAIDEEVAAAEEPANSARTCKDSQEISPCDSCKFDKDSCSIYEPNCKHRINNSQELTEFEIELYNLIQNPHGTLCEEAKRLLSIARKQIASEIDVDAMVSDTIICENLAYYRQGIEDTLKAIKGE